MQRLPTGARRALWALLAPVDAGRLGTATATHKTELWAVLLARDYGQSAEDPAEAYRALSDCVCNGLRVDLSIEDGQPMARSAQSQFKLLVELTNVSDAPIHLPWITFHSSLEVDGKSVTEFGRERRFKGRRAHRPATLAPGESEHAQLRFVVSREPEMFGREYLAEAARLPVSDVELYVSCNLAQHIAVARTGGRGRAHELRVALRLPRRQESPDEWHGEVRSRPVRFALGQALQLWDLPVPARSRVWNLLRAPDVAAATTVTRDRRNLDAEAWRHLVKRDFNETPSHKNAQLEYRSYGRAVTSREDGLRLDVRLSCRGERVWDVDPCAGAPTELAIHVVNGSRRPVWLDGACGGEGLRDALVFRYSSGAISGADAFVQRLTEEALMPMQLAGGEDVLARVELSFVPESFEAGMERVPCSGTELLRGAGCEASPPPDRRVCFINGCPLPVPGCEHELRVEVANGLASVPIRVRSCLPGAAPVAGWRVSSWPPVDFGRGGGGSRCVVS